jgi:gamma-butyrobetaine dioxygenase
MIDRVEKAGDTVTVSFGPDPHVSTFSLRWLSAQRPGPQGDGRTEQDKRLWKANDLVGALPVKRWSAYCDEGAERARVLAWVVSLGFAILQEVPKQDGTVLEVVKSFGYVRETNYGELFEVRVELSPSNLAFTGLAIAPHTDNPYRDPVPTLQLLHCLSNAADGGASGLVDGFGAAATLRKEDPAAFETLTTTLVPFAWQDARARLSAERPLIEIDPLGRIRAVRFNNRSMQALRLAREDLVSFYDAYRAFAEVISRPGHELTFRLEPGDCLIFDNTRVLHSRTAFDSCVTGSRHLQGCYADMDGLMSTLAVLTNTP